MKTVSDVSRSTAARARTQHLGVGGAERENEVVNLSLDDASNIGAKAGK